MIGKAIFSIFVLLLVVGGCATGYGYFLENSANRIVEKEMPNQKEFVIQYKTELNVLENKASEVYQRWQDTEKAYNDYVQSEYDYLIGTGVSMLIPLPSVISGLSTLSTIGDLLSHAQESIEKLDEFMEAKENYHKEYEAVQRKIENKKQLIYSTEETIGKLRDTADSRIRNAPKAKLGGTILAGIGVFGLILSIFKKRGR